MGPGGSPGLQNRVCPDKIGTGGFDSHVLPQKKPRNINVCGAFSISIINLGVLYLI